MKRDSLRQHWLGLAAGLAFGTTGAIYAGTDSSASPGINLAGPCDWNTELPLVDVMRFSRSWSLQWKGLAFGAGPELPLSPQGYPVELPPDAWAESPVISFEGHPWPPGTYTVFFDGRGRLGFNAPAVSVQENGPGRLEIGMDPSKGNLHVSILETDPEDPVRNIRIFLPGHTRGFPGNAWNPDFLRRWEGVTCLRFMDFMATNHSKIRRWNQRPVPEDATFAGRGVPLEYMIDLANRLRADPWFCIPHLADDDYVRNFAGMVLARLAPDRRVYVEYSNEVWNPGFAQHRYAMQSGLELGLSKDPREAVWFFTVRRSHEIHRIFEEVFGGTDRLVRILPCQNGNLHMAKKMLAAASRTGGFDAIAIAPYVGINVPPGGDAKQHIPSAETVARWAPEELFGHLFTRSLPEVTESISGYSQLAAAHGMALVAYEGGQHLVGIQGAENLPELTSLFQAANRDPRMAEIYHRLLDAWSEAGGGVFCHFSSVSRWNKWGSWGLLEYYNDDFQRSPKFSAFAGWAARSGHPLKVWEENVPKMEVREDIDSQR